MRFLRTEIASLLGLGLLICGCSSEIDETTTSDPGPVLSVFHDEQDGEDEIGEATDLLDDRGPVVESIRFEPSEPVGRQRWQARVEVDGAWTSLRYDWRRNGETFGRNASEVVLPALSNGDEIVLRVTPYRGSRSGEAFEVRQRVSDQKPRIQHLSLERVEADDLDHAGTEQWRAIAAVDDAIEDDVRIEYRWRVNGLESEIEDAVFPAGQLKRGDRLAVTARAFNGHIWSAPSDSGEIEIGNMPPSIESTPPRPDASGYFRYAVRAKDPDGDKTLRFALSEAPSGMEIDEVEGILTWRPTSDQAGRHAVQVVVKDGQGGEASQSFSLALISSEDSEIDAPGPAARR